MEHLVIEFLHFFVKWLIIITEVSRRTISHIVETVAVDGLHNTRLCDFSDLILIRHANSCLGGVSGIEDCLGEDMLEIVEDIINVIRIIQIIINFGVSVEPAWWLFIVVEFFI